MCSGGFTYVSRVVIELLHSINAVFFLVLSRQGLSTTRPGISALAAERITRVLASSRSWVAQDVPEPLRFYSGTRIARGAGVQLDSVAFTASSFFSTIIVVLMHTHTDRHEYEHTRCFFFIFVFAFISSVS